MTLISKTFINHQNWMARTAEIEHLRIDELILPGSHNSCSDKKSPNLKVPQEIAQDVEPLEQLRQGIRVLDLRIAFYAQKDPWDPQRFQLFHLTSSGRTVAVDVLQTVLDFLAELEHNGQSAREVIILDFHDFHGFCEQAHKELQALVADTLGQRVIPWTLRELRLKELWKEHPGKNVVLAYNHNLSGDAFWDGVLQRWPGENVYNTNTLRAFMDEVSREYKPAHSLTAIQCAKYSIPMHQPTDLSAKIDQWFLSQGEQCYIQNFYIINTDWSLRSRLVANCMHANKIRGAYRRLNPDQSLQPVRRKLKRG